MMHVVEARSNDASSRTTTPDHGRPGGNDSVHNPRENYRRSSTTPQRQQESPSSYRRTLREGGIPLQDFVLTRLPNVRNVSAHTDDSPSSVLVHPGLSNKTKQQHKELVPPLPTVETSQSWKQRSTKQQTYMPLNSNATAATCTSRDSSSQQSAFRLDAYSKPEDDFTVEIASSASKRQQDPPAIPHVISQPRRNREPSNTTSSSSLFKTLNQEIRMENEDDSSNSGSSNHSGLGMDAFLDSRLLTLLDESKVSVKPQTPADGTEDNPVDLTGRYSSRLHDEEDIPKPQQTTHIPPSTPEQEPRRPPNIPTEKQQQHHTPQRQPAITNSQRATSAGVRSTRPAESTPPRRSSSFFDPILTGFSPQNQFMGGIFYHNKTNILSAEELRQQQRQSDDSDDASSVDSETLLEMWSSQIRAQLRQEAMVEMALEAERAAEAGEERFSSSRPWAYGEEFHRTEEQTKFSSSSPMMKNYLMLRRNASYTEGCTPIMSRASSIVMPRSSLLPIPRRFVPPPKVAYRDLRDVNEVFPCLDVFHKNLRTHLARNNVSERILVFEEIDRELPLFNERKIMMNSFLDHSSVTAHSRGVNTTICSSTATMKESSASFLDSFTFDLLGGTAGAVPVKVPSETEDQGTGDNDGIGELLAEHLHSSSNRRRPPRQEILPGLEDLSISFIRHPASNDRVGSKREVFVTPKHRLLVVLKEEGPMPRALFDQEAYSISDMESFDEAGESSILSYTPVAGSSLDQTGNSSTNKSGDFVTPARLRKIRGKDGALPTEYRIPLPLLQEKADAVFMENGSVHQQPPLSRSCSSPASSTSRRDTRTPPALLMPTLPSVGSFDNHADASTLESRAYSPKADSPFKEEDVQRSRPWQRRRLFSTKTAPSTHSPIELVPLLRDMQYRQGPIIEASPSIEQNEGFDEKKEADAATPTLKECNCLSISSSPSMEDCEMPDSANHFSGTGMRHGAEQHGAKGPEPFASAMKMFSHLSPKYKRKSRRVLYVGLQENDDFMQNFLYCGKRLSAEAAIPKRGSSRTSKVCAEPCQDEGCDADNVTAAAHHCYAAFVLDDSEPITTQMHTCGALLGSVSSGKKDSLFLRSDKTPHKAEPETWFDVATEKVDGVIESLVGTTPQNEWSLSFQPPSLRKNQSTPANNRRWLGGGALDATLEDKAAESSLSPSNSSVHSVTSGSAAFSPSPSTPISTLFETQDYEMSDAQFHLVYGISKEEHRSRSERRRDLRTSVSLEHMSPPPFHRSQNSLLKEPARHFPYSWEREKSKCSNLLAINKSY